MQQPREVGGRVSARAHRGKFDVADAGTSFAPRAGVAYGKGSQLRVVPHERRVAKALFRDGANFALHVEPFEIRIRNFAARGKEAGEFFEP